MKNFPIWLAKLLLVAAGLIYWGVPQWIIHSSENDPHYKDLAIGYKAIGQFRIPQNENERFRILEDSLRKDIEGTDDIVTPEIYFQTVWKHTERSRRFGYDNMAGSLQLLHFQGKMHGYVRQHEDWDERIIAARDKYRDLSEPGWREREKQSGQEFNDFIKRSPSLLLKIYVFNIFFSFVWFVLTYVSKKKYAKKYLKDIPILNPLSLCLSALIWPYFFFRSLIRAWLESQAEVHLRATKVNPFSLLSIDERALVKKFAQSVRVERKEILQSIRRGKRHSVSFALCATLCVRILPLYAAYIPVAETHAIECSVTENEQAGHETIDRDVGWVEKCEAAEDTSWKPFPQLFYILLFFTSSHKCLRGVRRKFDHIPLCGFILIVCINLKLHIKKYLYEKNKNYGSTLPPWNILARTRFTCCNQISVCWPPVCCKILY